MTADADRELTYDTATPEQVAEARATARRKLHEARERHSPEYWAQLRARLALPAKTA